MALRRAGRRQLEDQQGLQLQGRGRATTTSTTSRARFPTPFDQDVFASEGSGFQGTTDDSRPSFAQNGNTYIALRDVQPRRHCRPTTSPDYQYFGLATPFRELALTGQLDYSQFDPFHISLIGEFVDNMAFDSSAIREQRTGEWIPARKTTWTARLIAAATSATTSA